MNKLFLTLFILLGAIAFGATKAEAATFLLAQGSDGGSLYATANTLKYDHAPGEEVRATVCVDNQSSKINLSTTSGGTNGVWKVLFTGNACINDRVGYAPSSAGTYAANFETNFTRTNPACSDGVDNDGDGLIDYPNDPGCYGPQDEDEYNAPVATTIPFSLNIVEGGNCAGNKPCILGTISLASALSQSVTFNIGHDFWHSGVNGPENSFISISVPAGQTSSSGWTALYGSPYSYLTPDNGAPNSTVVDVIGGSGTTQLSATGSLPSGLAPINSTTSLQLTNYNASYNFRCAGNLPSDKNC